MVIFNSFLYVYQRVNSSNIKDRSPIPISHKVEPLCWGSDATRNMPRSSCFAPKMRNSSSTQRNGEKGCVRWLRSIINQQYSWYIMVYGIWYVWKYVLILMLYGYIEYYNKWDIYMYICIYVHGIFVPYFLGKSFIKGDIPYYFIGKIIPTRTTPWVCPEMVYIHK